jgi:hypothetical protein
LSGEAPTSVLSSELVTSSYTVRARMRVARGAASPYLNESDRSKRLTPKRSNTGSVTGESKPRQAGLALEGPRRRSREVTKGHKIQYVIELYADNGMSGNGSEPTMLVCPRPCLSRSSKKEIGSPWRQDAKWEGPKFRAFLYMALWRLGDLSRCSGVFQQPARAVLRHDRHPREPLEARALGQAATPRVRSLTEPIDRLYRLWRQ